MTLPIGLRTSLRPQAGMTFDRLGLAIDVAVVFSYKDITLKVKTNQPISQGFLGGGHRNCFIFPSSSTFTLAAVTAMWLPWLRPYVSETSALPVSVENP